jgi:hypothetical protein
MYNVCQMLASEFKYLSFMWSCVEGLICTGCGVDAFSYDITQVWQYFKIYETVDLWSYPLISVLSWKAHTHARARTHAHQIYVEAGYKK